VITALKQLHSCKQKGVKTMSGLKLVKVENILKSDMTFPWSGGKIIMDPAGPKDKKKVNWVPVKAIEELGADSISWKDYIKKEVYLIRKEDTRTETEQEQQKRLKTAGKMQSFKKNLVDEKNKPALVSSEEINTAVEEGKKTLQSKLDELKELIKVQLSTDKENFDNSLDDSVDEKLEAFKTSLNEHLESDEQKAKKTELDALLKSVDEATLTLEAVKVEVAKQTQKLETAKTDLDNELKVTLDKFRIESDKITKAHKDAQKSTLKAK
jgi:hypothetical protein